MTTCSRRRWSPVEAHAGMHCSIVVSRAYDVAFKYTVFDCQSTPSNFPVSDREAGERTRFLNRLATALFLVSSSEPNLRKPRNLSQCEDAWRTLERSVPSRMVVLKSRGGQHHARYGERVFRPNGSFASCPDWGAIRKNGLQLSQFEWAVRVFPSLLKFLCALLVRPLSCAGRPKL